MACHIKELNIETYRGIQELSINDLGGINVFVGDNNCGKTSILEAIQLLCDPTEYNLVRIARQRERYSTRIRMGLSIFNSVLYLFNISNKNETNNYKISVGGNIYGISGKVEIQGELTKRLVDFEDVKLKRHALTIEGDQSLEGETEEISAFIGQIKNSFTISKNGQMNFYGYAPIQIDIDERTRTVMDNSEEAILNISMLQTVDHITDNAFQALVKDTKIRKRAIELLKIFDDSITDIRYIDDNTRFIPMVESNNEVDIPLTLYGDGMKKALTMLKAVIRAENGVVLIDEFETALHTSAMRSVFRFMIDIAKTMGVQLFLTTHSIEAVDKLLECSDNDIGDIRIIRLKKKNNKTYARVSYGKEALKDRKEYNMEFRI